MSHSKWSKSTLNLTHTHKYNSTNILESVHSHYATYLSERNIPIYATYKPYSALYVPYNIVVYHFILRALIRSCLFCLLNI